VDGIVHVLALAFDTAWIRQIAGDDMSEKRGARRDASSGMQGADDRPVE
jgi:hypothetical protein